MKVLILFIIFIISVDSKRKTFVSNPFEKRVVYGRDDRTEVDISVFPAEAVAGVFWKTQLYPNAYGNYDAWLRSYTCDSGRKRPCSGERFRSQPVGPWCSSFLIGPQTVVSAGHCTESADKLRFVFGFTSTKVSNFTKNEVYDCKRVVRSVNTRTEDWAVFELDRKVESNRKWLNVSSAVPSLGDPLMMLGFPMGLPMKADVNANVKGITETLIAANLDAFAGNSGSPIINTNTMEVVGILVSGNSDFILTSSGEGGGCCETRICSSTSGCSGTYELATRISRIHLT